VIASCNGPYIPYVRIHKTDTLEAVMSWEENLNRRIQLAEYNKPQIVYLRVPINGFSTLVKLHLPPEIEWPPSTTSATDKYPMIVQVYAGPNSVRGVDNYAIGLPEYYTTTRKVIHCQIDGRGSGNKGTDMMFAINNHMGTVEIEDQIAVTEYLQKTYSFIDAERTGIWGWSYGGYATAMVLATDEKRVFQCGVSVAPVTSWIYYDSIYTERYMGLPTDTDNLGGYNRTDVTRLVDNIKYHDFLLIHGNADDNVHYQQAMVLARALQEKSIMFEQMVSS
jgi:dipeptidyl-peptidase 4